MDSTSALLKQEINQTQEAEHDLAKWKLVVTAALGATAFGLAGQSNTNLWLLLFIPFVCAYVDLYDYQYRLRVFVIAMFLRERARDEELKEYEWACEHIRQSRAKDFDLGKWAGLGSSVVASILGPLFYVLALFNNKAHEVIAMPLSATIPIWIFSLILVVYLYWDFHQKEKKLSLLPPDTLLSHVLHTV
ncbi:MAG TPA: hypothetical protein VHD85_17995 [Terracidiphilus sp.]|jgi:hypothetical protein|nr:hypothetical protein [Terracidiphilus sp.]